MAGTSSPRSVLSQSVKPSIRTGSSGTVAASAATRSVADLDRRPGGRPRRAVAGDPVVELGVARPGGREEPDAAALAGQPGRGGESEPALAAPRPTERQDQRVSHVGAGSSRDGRRRPAQQPRSVSMIAPIPSPSSCRATAHDRGGNDEPDRRTSRAPRWRAAGEPMAMARPAVTTTAITTATTASPRPTRAANQPPNPPASTRDGASATVTTGRVRPTTAATMSAAPAARAPADDARLASAATSIAEHEDERDRAAGPDGRVLPRALGGRPIGCQERVGRVRQPVEVERPGQHGHRPDREDPREDRLAGRRRGRAARHRRARRSRRPAGTPPHRSRLSRPDATGSRVSRAIAARSDAPAPARRAAAAGAAGVVGGTSTATLSSPRSAGGRGPDRRRTRPGCGRCRASSRADRRRRSGRRA